MLMGTFSANPCVFLRKFGWYKKAHWEVRTNFSGQFHTTGTGSYGSIIDCNNVMVNAKTSKDSFVDYFSSAG